MISVNCKRLFALVSLTAALSVAMSTTAGTTHYRWQDDRGNTVYSDRPPPKGIDYEVMKTGSSFKRIVDGDTGAVPLEINPSAGNEFTRVNQNDASRSKKNAELCNRAKTNLDALQNSPEVKVRNDQGEERLLTPEEIIVETEKARAQISVYCP